MTTINKFSASANIQRDLEQDFFYIPTSNAENIFNQIAYSFASTKQHAFNIVGAYGSGKSSFLLAFERTINKKKDYFPSTINYFQKFEGFDFLPIVGEYESLEKVFIKTFSLPENSKRKDILTAIANIDRELQKQNKGLVILIDEFGKFLEYAAKNNPEREIYFIQELAEFVCDDKKNIILISTLHQGLGAYSYELTQAQRSEWRKVEGRLKELTFNEPIEQLLDLASKHLAQSYPKTKQPDNFSVLFETIKTANKRLLRDKFSEKFAKSLYPFDILTATVLTQALQRYGQNERSLFSFLNSDDYLGIQDFKKSGLPYFNLGHLYDYLYHNFYSFLNTKYNPDYLQWISIKNSIEQIEGDILFEDFGKEIIELVKTIGLLNIFASVSAKIDSDFLLRYLELSSNTNISYDLIKKLEQSKRIRFSKHSQRYILFEGTDVDFEKEIQKSRSEIDPNFDIVKALNDYFDFPYISAKQVLLQRGTPRIFAFQISEVPLISLEPQGEKDGFINLIFSLHLTENEIIEQSEKCDNAVLFGLFTNTEKIREAIIEIEAIKKARIEHHDDEIARREFTNLENQQIELLNKYVLENLNVKNENITWIFKGKKLEILSIKQFNRELSNICNEIYHQTPIYWNEMINVTELSSAMILARKNLISQLVENYHKEELGFDKTSFLPEKTIYLSLIAETGVHRKENDTFILDSPKDDSFLALWQAGQDFLNLSKSNQKNLSLLVDILLQKPFKLKKGFVEFWLPIFLFTKRNDFALYEDGIYKPDVSADDFDIMVKYIERFEIKAFDVEGVKLDIFNSYRSLINKTDSKNPTNETFIETIKPFLTFFNGLDNYTKKTSKLPKHTLHFRKAIESVKDPEKAFFEDFPQALGFSLIELKNSPDGLENFATQLQDSIRELRTCFDNLISRFEKIVIERTGIGEFPEYKQELQKKFKKVRKHAILQHQEAFYRTVNSVIDDRKSWLSAIAHACLGKHLDNISDEDEKRLKDRFEAIVYELDNLSELTKADFDKNKEDVYEIQLTSFVEGLRKNLVRLPKQRTQEMIKIENEIKKVLEINDKSINIAILARLLQEQLRND